MRQPFRDSENRFLCGRPKYSVLMIYLPLFLNNKFNGEKVSDEDCLMLPQRQIFENTFVGKCIRKSYAILRDKLFKNGNLSHDFRYTIH